MQRYSSTWSKFVQTSIAFHQNLSKEGRSMMLEDHRSSAQFCQRQISNTYFRQISNFSQIPKKSSYPKISTTSTCNCSVDRWPGKLELCGTDMTGAE